MSRKYLNRFLHNHRLVIGKFGSSKMLFEKGICSFQVFDTEDFQIIEEATLLRVLNVRPITGAGGKWAIGSVDDLRKLATIPSLLTLWSGPSDGSPPVSFFPKELAVVERQSRGLMFLF